MGGSRKLVTSQREEDPTKEDESYEIERVIQKRVRNGVVSIRIF
jgi:hypothetical protein